MAELLPDANKLTLLHLVRLGNTAGRHWHGRASGGIYSAWLCAQAAALGGDLGADGELAVPALLESEDPASVLFVRARRASMLEPAVVHALLPD